MYVGKALSSGGPTILATGVLVGNSSHSGGGGGPSTGLIAPGGGQIGVLLEQHRSRQPGERGENPSTGHCSTQLLGRTADTSSGQKITHPGVGAAPTGQAVAHVPGLNGPTEPSGHRGTGQHGSAQAGGCRLPSLGQSRVQPHRSGLRVTPAGHGGWHPGDEAALLAGQTLAHVAGKSGAGEPS
jgi:hypothetical protein